MSDDIQFTFSSVSGMGHDSDSKDTEDLVDLKIMHDCIQSDPGEPTRWKDGLFGPEQEWWLKSTISEFNNFLSRNPWKFFP